MEFLKNEEAVSPGESGEIICTSLVNYGMPLVRYKLGDVGVYCEEQCSCGRKLPLMKIVEGRNDDFLITLDGKSISPTIFFPYPFENIEGIRQFRVIQEKKDELKIQLVARDNFLKDNEVLEKAKREIKNVFGEINVEFQLIEKIDKDPNGKLRKVISHLPS